MQKGVYKMKKAIVLSSGGIDSTTCISIAVNDVGAENVTTLSLYYGQKHKKELECAKKIAKYYGVKHIELDIENIMAFSNCSLLEHSTSEIIKKSYAEQIKEGNNGIVNTYVPFRNGLILSMAGTLGMSLCENSDDKVSIYIGNHADDYAHNAYADCSVEFVKAINEAINIGTYGKVSIVSPFKELNKASIVSIGHKLNTPYHLTWSCYEGKDKPCGSCGTCIDRKEAFRKNNLVDPIEEM